MTLFRAANSAADADWSVPSPRGPYPVGQPFPDADGPTERLYTVADEPQPLAEPDGPGTGHVGTGTRRERRPGGGGPGTGGLEAEGADSGRFDAGGADTGGFPADGADTGAFAAEGRANRAGRGVALAIVLAVLALVGSAGASLIAWQALGRADRAGAMAHHPAATPAPAPTATPSTGGTIPAVPAGGTVAGVPAGYTLSYAQEPLRLQAPCGAAAFVDLGAPRAGVPQPQADLRYDNPCGPDGPVLSVGPAGRAGSLVGDPDTDAPGCAAAIGSRPLGKQDGVPIRAGTTLCVLSPTNGGTRLSLVEVTDVDETGTAGLRVTAWLAPPGPMTGPDQATASGVPAASGPASEPATDAGASAPPETVVPSGEAAPGE